MKPQPQETTPRPGGPVPLAESLAKTLQEEHDALGRLAALFEEHREALRTHRQDLLEEATLQTNEVVSTLDRLRQARDRQMRLLGRVLRVASSPPSIPPLAAALAALEGGGDAAQRILDLREALHAQAAHVQYQCRDLEFALSYALDLGREMIQALQGVDAATAPARVYTPKGAAAQQTGARSFLNTLG
jgi:hypothetical protein